MTTYRGALKAVWPQIEPLVEARRKIEQAALATAFDDLFEANADLQTLQISTTIQDPYDEPSWVFTENPDEVPAHTKFLINGLDPSGIIKWDYVKGTGWKRISTEGGPSFAALFEAVDDFLAFVGGDDIEDTYGACISLTIARGEGGVAITKAIAK